MEKIVRKRVSDQVFDRLVSMIEGGEFRPADQLPSERELVTRFGVGRPAVREAMQNLEAVGLITISHGERARVTQPTAAGIISQIDHSARHLLSTTPKSLDHLKEVREFFEVGMARQAAERSNRKSVARLKAALDEQRRHLRGDPAKFVAADMAFHVSIASMTGNPIFEASSRAMLQWLSRYHSGVLHWKGKETVTLEEHASILAAIAGRDADRAGENMRAHLRRTRSIYKADALRTNFDRSER